jgi:threonine aldolase
MSAAEDRRKLREACHTVYPGFRTTSPAETFSGLAAWCEAGGVRHDAYGEGGLIAEFEAKMAALLGKPAAVFMPSGTMAQLIAVRIWTERRRLDRFGLHPTSHLLLHEREGYQALLRLHGVPVGDRHRPVLAPDLEIVAQPLACLLVELPAREIGGQAPSWDELEALKGGAISLGLPLHMDGARLWECRAFYERSHAEIAEGFGSIYVSMYKGLGGLAGAVLAGEAAFIAEARLWQRRMGGNLVTQTALVASAAMRLETRLALMDALYARALSLAVTLGGVPGIRVNPATPQSNMMHLFFDAPRQVVLERRDEIAKTDGVWVINDPRTTSVPGWCASELYVGDTLLEIDNAEVLQRLVRLVDPTPT